MQKFPFSEITLALFLRISFQSIKNKWDRYLIMLAKNLKVNNKFADQIFTNKIWLYFDDKTSTEDIFW